MGRNNAKTKEKSTKCCRFSGENAENMMKGKRKTISIKWSNKNDNNSDRLEPVQMILILILVYKQMIPREILF